MKITLKKIANGWVVSIPAGPITSGYMCSPVEHFEPTLDKAVAFIKEQIGEK